MATLTNAARQWATRPDDESYLDLKTLHDAVLARREISREGTRALSTLRTTVSPDGDVVLAGQIAARMTGWSFGQLCRIAQPSPPPSYLSLLPAPLVVDNLNHGLEQRSQGDPDRLVKLYAAFEDGGALARAFTTDEYTRIYDADVTSRLLRLQELGPWQPAPPAFNGRRGLYASTHDMFAFMVDSDRRIFEKRPGGGMSRGFFAWNSEVGKSALGLMTFLYDFICGNHYVWGATEVKEMRLRHVGDVDKRFNREFVAKLTEYAEASAEEDEVGIKRAMEFSLGKDKEEVLDRVFGLRQPALSKARIEKAYEIAVEHEDWYGSPRSAFGMMAGLTELARDIPYADTRTEIDRQAAKLMDLAQ